MAYIKSDDLPQIRKNFANKKIVYCSGCFDLTHAGHILFFEDCKKLGNILVVGVGSDRGLKEYKGEKRPILNEHIRLKTVESLKPVDFVFIDDGYKRQDPLFGVRTYLSLLNPDIYVFNDDAYDVVSRKKIATGLKVKIRILKRWCPKEYGDLSTTGIIKKISSLKF